MADPNSGLRRRLVALAHGRASDPDLVRPARRRGLACRAVVVGTAVARCTPHRSVHAALPHTVSAWMDNPNQTAIGALLRHYRAPALPGTVSGAGPCLRISLAICPEGTRFPPCAPRPSPLSLVRALRRYYAAARLPAAVHEGLIAHRFLPPASGVPPRAAARSPGSRA